MAYRYRGSPYRAIVHGQRADVVVGATPLDWMKVVWRRRWSSRRAMVVQG